MLSLGPLLGGGTIIYQRSPTLRIYTPGNVKAMGKLHNDMDYHHQPSELNYWLPLCRCVDYWLTTHPFDHKVLISAIDTPSWSTNIPTTTSLTYPCLLLSLFTTDLAYFCTSGWYPAPVYLTPTLCGLSLPRTWVTFTRWRCRTVNTAASTETNAVISQNPTTVVSNCQPLPSLMWPMLSALLWLPPTSSTNDYNNDDDCLHPPINTHILYCLRQHQS